MRPSEVLSQFYVDSAVKYANRKLKKKPAGIQQTIAAIVQPYNVKITPPDITEIRKPYVAGSRNVPEVLFQEKGQTVSPIELCICLTNMNTLNRLSFVISKGKLFGVWPQEEQNEAVPLKRARPREAIRMARMARKTIRSDSRRARYM